MIQFLSTRSALHGQNMGFDVMRVSKRSGWNLRWALCAAVVGGALLAPVAALAQSTPRLPSVRLIQRTQLVSPGLSISTSSPAAKPATARIQDLADGLDRDPDRIYQFVRDNFEFEPQFGLHKGSDGVLMDRAGGAFDQAALMVDLLRASGLNAQYAVGMVSLGADAGSILRVTDAKAACILLASGGTPATVNGQTDCANVSGAIGTVQLLHVWVRAQIGAQSYEFDPSLKMHVKATGQDLWALAGSSANTAWSSAAPSLSQGARNVSGYSPATINATLTGIGSTLVTRLKTDMSSRSMEELVGGWSITPSGEAQLRQTSLPGASGVTYWTGEVPTAYRATLQIQTLGFDHTYDLPSIYGDRVELQMYSDPQKVATFRVYDQICEALPDAATTDPCNGDYRQGATVNAASWDGKILLTIDHKYPGGFGGETVAKSTELGRRVDLIVRTAGGAGERYSTHRAAVDPYFAANYVPPSVDYYECPPPNTELTIDPEGNINCSIVPNVFYFNGQGRLFSYNQIRGAEMKFRKDHLANLWAAQVDRALSLFEPLSQSRILPQHSLGLALQPGANGYGALDIDTALSVAPMGSTYQPQQVLQALSSALVAFESSALSSSWADREGLAEGDKMGDAIVNPYGLSAPERIATTATVTVLNPGETSALLPASTTAPVKAQVDAYLGQNFSVAFSAFPSGASFLARRSDGSENAWMIQEGDAVFRKGATSTQTPNPLDFLGKQEVKAVSKNLAPTKLGVVDLQSGALSFSEDPDVTVGVGEFPGSLSFVRNYNSSGAAAQGGGLGAGWSYNWASSASASSDAFALFPEADSATGAPTLIATLMFLEAGRRDTIEANLVAGAVARWWRGQMVSNVRNLSGGGVSGRFVRLVDGTWRNSASPSDVLTITGGEGNTVAEYDWRMSDGSVQEYRRLKFYDEDTGLNLGAQKALKAWRFPSGMRVDLEYAVDLKGNLESLRKVKNSLGYELVFTQVEQLDRQLCKRLTENECWQQGTYAGTLKKVQAGPDSVEFGYMTTCEKGSNLCYGRLGGVVHAGFKVRSYEYYVDPTKYSFLTGVTDDGQLRAAFGWSVIPGVVRPHVRQVTDARWHTSTFYTTGGYLGASRDAKLYRRRVVYDESGRQVANFDPQDAATRTQYDGMGRVVRVESPEQDSVVKTYDYRSNVLSEIQNPKPGASPPPPLTSYTSYVTGPTVLDCGSLAAAAICNKVASTTNPRNKVTEYTWNSGTGTLARVLSPADVDNRQPQVDFSYITLNGLEFLNQKIEKIDGSSSVTTTYEYDAANHYVVKASTVDPGGLNIRGCYKFDVLGNLTSVTDARASTCP
jgi:YD repeat-containing protein